MAPSVVYHILAVVYLFSVGECATPPPAFIQWPVKWHAEVLIADAGPPPATAAKINLPTIGSGNYFYNNGNTTGASVVFTMTSSSTSRSVRELVIGTDVRIIDGPTQACTSQPIGSSARYQSLPPDFLSKGKFTFVATEYYLRDSVFFATYHWTGRFPSSSTSQIDYWHAVETDAPFRLAWGPPSSSNEGNSEPSQVLEFTNVMSGLDDISNSGFLFSVPSSCKNATSKQSTDKEWESSSSLESRVSASGNAWPLQWHANSYFTGNNFGIQSIIGNPTVVPFSLLGHYYYDWANSRECNVWTDAVSNVRTKTLIVNKTFHLVTLATNSCLIVPTDPVDGPLKPTWPTALNYVDDQLLMPPLVTNPPSYARAQHFYFDAFQAGIDHSFHYWQTFDTQVPLQFQGPVLEIPPYGQSMMSWSQFEKGLSGIDVDDVFSVPGDCKHIPKDDKIITSNPMIQLQLALSRYHS